MAEMDLKESLKLVLGREPRPEEIQHSLAVAQAFGIPPDDPMFAIFAGLDIYHGTFSRLPQAVAKAVDKSAQIAAKNAASQAEAELTKAVAQLVPSVENAVTKAADRAMDRVRVMDSAITFWAILCVVAVVFMFGFGLGNRIFTMVQNGTLSGYQFWEYTKWGVAVGIAAPMLMLIAMADWLNISRAGPQYWRWTAFILSVLAILTLIYKVFSL